MGEDFLRGFSVGEWSEGVGLTREDDIPEFARDATFDHDSFFPGEVAWGSDTQYVFARHETSDVNRIIEEPEAFTGN